MYVIEQIRRCVEAESTFQLLPRVNFYAPDGNLAWSISLAWVSAKIKIRMTACTLRNKLRTLLRKTRKEYV